MVGRLINARYISEYASAVTNRGGAGQAVPADVLPAVVSQLVQLTSNFCQAAFIAPVSHSAMVATFSLLLSVLMQCDLANVINNSSSAAAEAFNRQLLPESYQTSMQQMISSVSACLPTDVVCLLSCIHFYMGPAHFLKHTSEQLEWAGGTMCQLTETNSVSYNAHCSSMTRVLAAVESSTLLLQSQSGHSRYIQKKQQVLQAWSSLPLILPAVLQALLTVVHSQLRTQVTRSGGASMAISDTHVVFLGVARLMLTATNSLLVTFGKKTYGAVSCSLFGTCAGFLMARVETGDATVLQTLLSSNNPQKALPFLKECLQLSQTIGRTSASSKVEGGSVGGASVPTSAEVLRLSFELLSGVSGQMHIATVRSEMLHPVLEAGWTLVKCFWVKPPMTAPGAPPAASTGEASGANVQHVVEFLTQLFATCMVNETVAPSDVLSCVDNMHSMSQDGRTLFSTPWFSQNCRQSVIMSSLRALVLNYHSAHHDNMVALLQVIVNQTSESRIEYAQYLGSVITGVSMEFGCQVEAEFVISKYQATLANSDSSGGGSSNKLDVDQYVQSVVCVVQKIISSSESCLKM